MGCVGDVAEIGLVILVQRSWDADDNCIHRAELRIVSSRTESVFLGRLNFFCGDTVDVGPALGKSVYLAGVDIEARYLKPLIAVEQGQGKTDVAKADDSDARLTLLNFSFELVKRSVRSRVSRHDSSGMNLRWIA